VESTSETDRLQKELAENKAIQAKQQQEIETLKQQLSSVTKSRDMLEETVRKLITQVSVLEDKVHR
jgi:predicted nuclease with TOPRIM domain